MIKKAELESLMVYISSFFLLHQREFTHTFIYNKRLYVAKFDTEFSNIVVKGLTEPDRNKFIKDFGKFALRSLFDMYKPETGYFIFNSDSSLFMTAIFNDKIKIKRITEKDLRHREDD